MAQVIQLSTAKVYLLERVGELKAQVPHGNPFVFLGAFSVLNALGRITGSSLYEILSKEYGDNKAKVVSTGARRMFEGFTLTEAPSPYDNTYERTLNLSHRDREHLKVKDSKLTISAGAFLEDVEKAINTAFDALDDEVAGARAFVRLNETPLIGYGG